MPSMQDPLMSFAQPPYQLEDRQSLETPRLQNGKTFKCNKQASGDNLQPHQSHNDEAIDLEIDLLEYINATDNM